MWAQLRRNFQSNVIDVCAVHFEFVIVLRHGLSLFPSCFITSRMTGHLASGTTWLYLLSAVITSVTLCSGSFLFFLFLNKSLDYQTQVSPQDFQASFIPTSYIPGPVYQLFFHITIYSSERPIDTPLYVYFKKNGDLENVLIPATR